MTLNVKTPLSCIEVNPTEAATSSVIWLHGLGADGNDFVPAVAELRLPAANKTRFVFPNAPVMAVTINNGYEMRAWYDIYEMAIVARIDEAGMSRSVQLVEELIANEVARGITTDRIILAGFSQGAVIALMTGLMHSQPLGGILTLSGYLPVADKVLSRASTANKGVPIFIGHGTEDDVVPSSLGKSAYIDLKQAGYPVEWHSYRMRHSVCGEEIADISQWLTKNISQI